MGTGEVGETGMDDTRAARAREMLVEGYRINYGNGTRRIYPSHAQVGREIGVPTSTVTRWAERTGAAKARAEVVAEDVKPDESRMTTEEIVAAVAAAVEARVKAGYLPSERLLAQVVRLAEWTVGRRALTTAALGRVQGLLAKVLDVGRSR